MLKIVSKLKQPTPELAKASSLPGFLLHKFSKMVSGRSFFTNNHDTAIFKDALGFQTLDTTHNSYVKVG